MGLSNSKNNFHSMLKKIFSLLIILLPLFSIAQNQNISGGVVFEGEPFMVQNPNNANHFVVAWIGYVFNKPVSIKTKTTFNSGQTWSNAVVLPHHGTTWHSADPSMDFDKAGNLYLCYVDYTEAPDSGGVYVIKSVDGGLTWGNSVKVIDAYADGNKRPLDRPWLSVDRSNTIHQNSQYVTTKPAPWIAAPNRPYFIRAANPISFLAWQYLDAANFLCGNLIQAPMAMSAVATDGTLYCIYPTYVTSQNILPGFILATSINGGASFNYKGAIYGTTNTSTKDSLAKLGYRLMVNPNDAMHIAFLRAGNPISDYDIFLTESLDGGNTWGNSIRVNDDALNNGKMQELVWGNFDEHGNIAMAWRDHRNAAGSGYTTGSEIYGAIKWKDSINASSNFKIGDTLTPYNATYLSQNGNDFMCVTMAHDTLNAAWGDVRTGKLNIYFNRTAVKQNSSSATQKVVSEDIPELKIYPNPANSTINFQLLNTKIKDVEVFNLEGEKFAEIENIKTGSISISKLAIGTYLLVVEDISGNKFSSKFIKE
jgi:hypothetical protein